MRREAIVDRVEVQTGGMCKRTFADATFDAVVSNVAIRDIYDRAGRAETMREIVRELKPRLFVLTSLRSAPTCSPPGARLPGALPDLRCIAVRDRATSNAAMQVDTPELLRRWHNGDATALAALVERSLPWLRDHVERRLGAFLRDRGDADDYLHDALLDFLRDGPRFQVRDERQFRNLLMRVIENTLRDKHDWFRAKRRNLGEDQRLPEGSVLDLDGGVLLSSTPSRGAAREESRAWVRLALELLDPEDRKVILGREYDQRSFEDIGGELGLTAAAARMRWTRAVARLAQAMRRLRQGDLDDGGAS